METLYKIALTLGIGLIILAILPVSPFISFIDDLASTPYLAYLNWFVPVGRCAILLVAWTTAIGVFYGVQWILRQLDIIGS